MRFSNAILGFVACTLLSVSAEAQNIDRAIEAYNDDQYNEAAFLFYDVIQHTQDADARVKAEYYIAQSLYKAGFIVAAYQFYGEVFVGGSTHPYFLKATEGLVRIADELGDDLIIPEIINRGYSEAFAGLKPATLNSINYLIGMVSYRLANYSEARDFLLAVPAGAKLFPKARYLLGIMAIRTARATQAGDYSEAIKYFDEVEGLLRNSKGDAEKKLYRIAQLGKARAYYSQGDWKRSIEYYEAVRRFSDDWYDAMFESGWAYFQNAEFGRSLGMVQSIQSPYFDGRYRAESFVLKATTYFQLCHFDRVRRTLEWFFKLYEPIADDLKALLESDRTDAEMVEMVKAGHAELPAEIRAQAANNRRFQKFGSVLDQITRELAHSETKLPAGAFKVYLSEMLKDQREQWTALTGRLVRRQLASDAEFLDDFLNRARIIKFETADAERKMLEAGKDITKGPRAKGPRPHVPSARYEYWGFQGEYWIDELGYYEHSIKDECIPEIFQ